MRERLRRAVHRLIWDHCKAVFSTLVVAPLALYETLRFRDPVAAHALADRIAEAEQETA